jgi:hypothetical protein
MLKLPSGMPIEFNPSPVYAEICMPRRCARPCQRLIVTACVIVSPALRRMHDMPHRILGSAHPAADAVGHKVTSCSVTTRDPGSHLIGSGAIQTCAPCWLAVPLMERDGGWIGGQAGGGREARAAALLSTPRPETPSVSLQERRGSRGNAGGGEARYLGHGVVV